MPLDDLPGPGVQMSQGRVQAGEVLAPDQDPRGLGLFGGVEARIPGLASPVVALSLNHRGAQ